MKPEITSGNAGQDGLNFGGWFVGDLTAWQEQAGLPDKQADYGLRDTGSLEVKWGVHRKGMRRPGGWAGSSPFTTLSLLVQGSFDLHFRAPGEDLPNRHCPLRSQGDYAIWAQDCEHTWEAVEDSVVLTVRWRSPFRAEAE